MTYGTAYFVSRAAANRYYKPYGCGPDDVERKLAEGEIHIGEPPLKPGDKLSVIDEGCRYAITERDDGTSGQDREGYTDDQDRENYTSQ